MILPSVYPDRLIIANGQSEEANQHDCVEDNVCLKISIRMYKRYENLKMYTREMVSSRIWVGYIGATIVMCIGLMMDVPHDALYASTGSEMDDSGRCVASESKELCCWEMSGAVSHNVLHTQFVSRNRPVLLRGAAGQWPAVHLWGNLSYWREASGEDIVEVEAYNEDNLNRDFVILMKNQVEVSMSLNRFIDYIETNSARDMIPGRYHLSEFNLLSLGVQRSLLAVHDDFPFPYMFDRNDHIKTSLFMGNNTSTQMHYHTTSEAVLVQLVGDKEFLLIPPWSESVPPPSRTKPGYCASGPPCWPRNNSDVQKMRTAPDAINLVLHPGDVLYIPWLWWHSAWSKPDKLSIAIAHFWKVENFSKFHDFSASIKQEKCVNFWRRISPYS